MPLGRAFYPHPHHNGPASTLVTHVNCIVAVPDPVAFSLERLSLVVDNFPSHPPQATLAPLKANLCSKNAIERIPGHQVTIAGGNVSASVVI